MLHFRQLHSLQKELVLVFLVLTVFVFPLSNSLKSIFLIITTLLVVLDPEFRKQALGFIKAPWVIMTLVLLFLVVLGMLTGAADWKLKLIYANKYSKIAYLPILAFAFQDKRAQTFAIYAFILAMLITVTAYFLQMAGWVEPHASGFQGGVFHNRIDTGLFTAFAAYLAASLSAEQKSMGKRCMYASFAVVLSVHILFLNGSRTGYLVFAVLSLVFLCQQIPRRKLALFLPALSALAILIVYQSPVFKYNTKLAIQDVQQFQAGAKNTSMGYRLQFAQYSEKLFIEKPLLGYGTAGFTYQFSQDNPIPAWGPTLGDPHNQYWSFLVDYGLIGLMALLYFFYTIFQSTQSTKETQPIVVALLAAFLVANFCDSFFLLANGGYFFVLFAALGLGNSVTLAHTRQRSLVMEKAGLLC